MTFAMPKGQLCEGCPRFDLPRCGVTPTQGKVHVLFVGDQPDDMSASKNYAFGGHGGRIVQTAIHHLTQGNANYRGLNLAFTYAVQCASPDNSPPDKVSLKQCNPHLHSTIQRMKPNVIVAMGAQALKQLGFRQMFSEVQHKFLKHFLYEMPIYVSFSEKALIAAPGVFETFKLNLHNIFDRALEAHLVRPTLEQISENYATPKTIDDAIAVCKSILDFTEDPLPLELWPLSIDTETTSLHSHLPTSKIIAFCFGWGRRKAATILYEHPFAGEEYLARLPELWEWIKKILQSKKPKIFHNAKFDLKFIELRYNTPVTSVVWDTLLGEHLLDEDKKGNYGLKVLTANLLPEYCGYEDKLYDLLESSEDVSKSDEAQKEIESLTPIIAEEHPEFLKSLHEYKVELEKYESEEQAFKDSNRRYALELDDYLFCKSHLAGLAAVWDITVSDYQKGARNKPKKPTKWFQKPTKPARLVEPKKPKDPRSKKEQQISKDAGFENIPIHELQLYGAVDADVTRQLAGLQKRRIAAEKSGVTGLMKTHAIPASRVLGRMEYFGTRIDQPYIDVLEEALSKVIAQTEHEIYEMSGSMTPSGKPMNLNGAATLGNVLYNWGWKHPDGTRMEPYAIPGLTAKGQPSTSEKLLRTFVAYEDEAKLQPVREALFVERLLKYRKASKARNTFLANIRALSRRDGFLHTQFHLNGTGTGRLSCVAADTQLETNLGTFSISDPVLQQLLPYLKVKTHKNRWRRVLRVFPKGHDPMFRVTTGTGEVIECTMDHRFLTPSGWKKLRELDVAQEVQTYVEDADRSTVVNRADRRQRNAAGSPRQSGAVSHDVLSINGVSREIQKGIARSVAQTVCSLETRKYAREDRTARDRARQGRITKSTSSRRSLPRHDEDVQLQRIFIDSQYAVSRADIYCGRDKPSTLLASRQLPTYFGEARTISTWSLCGSQAHDRRAGSVFSNAAFGAFEVARSTMGASLHGSQKSLLHGQYRRLVLEPESVRSTAGASFRSSEHTVPPRSSAEAWPRTNANRFFNRRPVICRGGWAIPQNAGGTRLRPRQRDIGSQDENASLTVFRIKSVAPNERRTPRDSGETPVLQTQFRISRIQRIEPLGVQEVWDLSVEEDESYLTQGYISHNSSDMNVQNLPKFLAGWNLKKLFIPDDDSYIFVNVDYKGAEVRVFTAYAKDKALIQALNDGMDMHSFFASKVFRRDYSIYENRFNPEVVTDVNLRKLLDMERSQIKRVVFGILYGAGPDKIAETIGISAERATALIEMLYQMFPDIKRYAEEVEREVDRFQFVETKFGRRRRFPLAGISRLRGRAHRQARNFKIQSTSSDIVLGQLIEMEEPLRADFGGRMLMTVHDSIVFQFPRNKIMQLNDFVKHYAVDRVREKYQWLPVPFEADIEVGLNYGECQSIEKYLAKYPLQLAQEGVVEEHELLTELRNAAFEAA